MAINKALLILILAGGLTAQSQVRTATVEGTVKNLTTGEPIADVRIALTSEGTTTISKTATTDADGRFFIEGIPSGRYAVTATRTLFFRPRRNAGAVALTLTESERLRNVQIFLSPTGVIAGRVVDEKRDPLRSVRVEALRREFRDGGRVWVQTASSTTDDRGDYRLFNLQPGTYYVRATQSGITPLYYPSVVDSKSAVPIALVSGNEASAIDIEMRRTPEYSLQFKLEEMPAASTATFVFRRRNGELNEQQTIRPENLPNGAYRVKLTSGAYDMLIQIFSPTPQPRVLTHAGIIPVDVGNADRDLGTITVPQTKTVTGRIVVPEPLPSLLAPERLALLLRPLDMPLTMTFSVRGSSTPPGFNPDGSFTLPGVGVGRYQIQLTGLPPDTYLVSAREGTRDVLDTGYTVSGDHRPLELTVGGPRFVGSVEGSVTNSLGQPVPAATVVLVPSPERRGNPAAFRNATTDQFGSFSLRSVFADDYKVIAWEELEPGLYMDPEFLKSFETRGETVQVQRGSRSTVSVRVIPAAQ